MAEVANIMTWVWKRTYYKYGAAWKWNNMNAKMKSNLSKLHNQQKQLQKYYDLENQARKNHQLQLLGLAYKILAVHLQNTT